MTTIPYDYNRHQSYPKISQEYGADEALALMKGFKGGKDIKGFTVKGFVDNLRLHYNYCDTSEINVNCFHFFWPYDECNEYIKSLALLNHEEIEDGDVVFPVMKTIFKIATSLCVIDEPFYDFEDSFYFDHAGRLKIFRTLRLTDPCDENDDGVEILLYDGMDEHKFDKDIDHFFFYAYTKYITGLPEELKKPITQLTDDEYQLFMMYVI